MNQPAATRSRVATRERMLDAAWIVLAREGLQGASVEHICDQAGFTRGAFYSNFSSKDDLLMALFEREHAVMLDRMEQAASGLDELSELAAADVMALIVERFELLQPSDRDWCLAHAEFELRSMRDDAVGRAYAQALHDLTAQMRLVVERVLAALGLRLTVDVGHVVTLLIGAYDTARREAVVERRAVDLSVLSETLPLMLLPLTEPVDGRQENRLASGSRPSTRLGT